MAGRLANSSTSAMSRQQSLAFFVRFGLPGGKEASFCSRKVSQGGRAEFGESDVSQVRNDESLKNMILLHIFEFLHISGNMLTDSVRPVVDL